MNSFRVLQNHTSVSTQNKMTLFKVTAVTLLALFLVPKHSEEQLEVLLRMFPDEEDQVLDKGATLNLTCQIDLNPILELDGNRRWNISWKLPDHLVQNKLVRINLVFKFIIL